MKRTTQVIQHPSQITGLKVWKIARSRGLGRIKIEAEGISATQIENWEQRLNRLYFACGCDIAALGLVVGTVGYIVWLGLGTGGLTRLGWNGLWTGLAVVILATAVGKFIGLWMAQRKLYGLIKEIQSNWKAEPLPKPEPYTCG